MKRKIKVQYLSTNMERIIVTLAILYTYKVKVWIFAAYILSLVLLYRDKYEVEYSKKIYPIVNVVIGYIMYLGMIVIIFPKKMDGTSIFWLIAGILMLKNEYVPLYYEQEQKMIEKTDELNK